MDPGDHPASVTATAPFADLEKSKSKDAKSFATWQKCIILFTVSWMALTTTFSSTCLYPVTEEIASDLETTSEEINISNAGVLIAMGSATLIWGPIAATVGRRLAYNIAITVFFLCSIGTALSINMPMFTAMRVLAGFQGTFMLVAGQTILTDIFHEKNRGTAVGVFMTGSLTGPAIGPLIGGIIATFANWRIVFWVQTAMVGLGLGLSLLFVPSIKGIDSVKSKPSIRLWAKSQMEMVHVFTLLLFPDVLLTDLACGCLAWAQYAILASPRQLINPRFHLTSPLVAGLFYIAIGAGFISGATLGGKWSDIQMRRKTAARDGKRVPQDRLYSGLVPFFVIVPAANLIYGWCLEKNVGGLPVAAISAFFEAFGLMAAFSSLNTYCTEAIPPRRLQVMASKYFIQYIFGAAGNAVILPLINSIGIGLASTIGTILVVVGGIMTLAVARYGVPMHKWMSSKLDWL